jgi:hypothetical protein
MPVSADMTNQEIIAQGRDKMDETDAELAIARRRVAETEATAVKTAEQLKKQTDQMQNVASDLNEIEFTMKRAGRVITDITRGLATDKCAPDEFATGRRELESSHRKGLSEIRQQGFLSELRFHVCRARAFHANPSASRFTSFCLPVQCSLSSTSHKAYRCRQKALGVIFGIASLRYALNMAKMAAFG